MKSVHYFKPADDGIVVNIFKTRWTKRRLLFEAAAWMSNMTRGDSLHIYSQLSHQMPLLSIPALHQLLPVTK